MLYFFLSDIETLLAGTARMVEVWTWSCIQHVYIPVSRCRDGLSWANSEMYLGHVRNMSTVLE